MAQLWPSGIGKWLLSGLMNFLNLREILERMKGENRAACLSSHWQLPTPGSGEMRWSLANKGIWEGWKGEVYWNRILSFPLRANVDLVAGMRTWEKSFLSLKCLSPTSCLHRVGSLLCQEAHSLPFLPLGGEKSSGMGQVTSEGSTLPSPKQRHYVSGWIGWYPRRWERKSRQLQLLPIFPSGTHLCKYWWWVMRRGVGNEVQTHACDFLG